MRICRFEEGAGHLCCDDVPPAAGCKTKPADEVGQGRASSLATHAAATLVYMGDGRFCVIESRVPEEDDDSNPHLRVLMMTFFGLKYVRIQKGFGLDALYE
ncbi:hypothetical protein HU200_003779 [Digitaria exilis]|uniref:Uncharacterized protein n=1 Tax=Digitaria exilis TaxID=1010633 RepID=A0A835KTZ5_9POAL|nr:hypothetical protein HU200_003779 [Digitaria exilis]